MKLVEIVTYPGLEGMSLRGSIPMQSVYSQVFCGRAESEVSTKHVFSGGVLAAGALVGGMARDGWARARARCEPGILLGSAKISTLVWGMARAQGLGAALLNWFCSFFCACVHTSNGSFCPD